MSRKPVAAAAAPKLNAAELRAMIRAWRGPAAFASNHAHCTELLRLARRRQRAGQPRFALLLLRRAEAWHRRSPAVQTALANMLERRGRSGEARGYRSRALAGAARRALRRGDVARILEVARELEARELRCPPPLAEALGALLVTEAGRARIREAAEALARERPPSVLLVYLQVVVLAEAGALEEARARLDEAMAAARREETGMRPLPVDDMLARYGHIRPILNDYFRRNALWAPSDAAADDAGATAGDGAEESVREATPGEAGVRLSLPLDALEKLRFSEEPDAYLRGCLALHAAAPSLDLRLHAIERMLREGGRRDPYLHESYAQARERLREDHAAWLGRAELLEAARLGREAEWRAVSEAGRFLGLARRLDAPEIVEALEAALPAAAGETPAARWRVAGMLIGGRPSAAAREAAEALAAAAGAPRTDDERRAFLGWARRSGRYDEARALWADAAEDAPWKARALGDWQGICEAVGDHDAAERAAMARAARGLGGLARFQPTRHWSLALKGAGSLRFARDTVGWLAKIPQPEAPVGVMFACARQTTHLRQLPLVTLMELKRRGWVVAPLFSHSLPPEATGVDLADRFTQAINPAAVAALGDAEREALARQIAEGRLVWRGIDLSQALYEAATVKLRRYSVDWSCPALRGFLMGLAEQAVAIIETLAAIRAAAPAGLRVGFMASDLHRLPYAALRAFCDAEGDAERFFCASAANAYENYFLNFSAEVSTRLSIRNVTAFPTMRVPFLPETDAFERWCARLDPSQGRDMLRRVEEITAMRRSTAGAPDEAHRAAVRERVRAHRGHGGKVACLFGKVVCDLAVPRDGGPAHTDMKDWLNHAIRAVREAPDALLLIKPHPHELKNEIGMFLTERFLDLIEEPLPDNVVVLEHRSFDLGELRDLIDLGLLYNGTTAVELGLMNIPAVLAAEYAPTDYPVGHVVPRDRAHFERLVRFEEPARPSPDLPLRSAAWLHCLDGEEVSVPYRYYARQLTNKVIHPSWWFEEDVRRYLREGDPHVARLAEQAVATRLDYAPPAETRAAAE